MSSSVFPRLCVLTCVMSLAACGGGGGSEAQGGDASGSGTISGAVTATLDSVTDRDTNDPTLPLLRNDSLETAQPIGNPSTVGGYAAQAGTGPEGALNRPGNASDLDDSSDVFKVLLGAGQALLLTVGDNADGDLDLYLGSADGSLIDASEGVGRQEVVVAPVAGEYLVEVFAYRGFSNYILETKASAAAAGGKIETFRYADAFVPGELIIDWSAGGGFAAAKALLGDATGADATAMPNREVLYRLPTAVGAKRAGGSGPVPILRPSAPDERLETLSAAKRLATAAGVRSVSLNYRRRPFAAATDPLAEAQWHYNLINVPAALDLATGQGVTVAVIDTGVLTDHPDLSSQLDPVDPNGFDFISDPANARDGNGIDSDGADVGDRLSASGSSSFHGTHVAGTVAAATNNGIGGAGVAPAARIMTLRALGTQGGATYDLMQAVRYAAGLASDAGPAVASPRAAVINMSFGGPQFSSIEADVYAQARARGVFLIAAAGNDNTSSLNYPASYPGVVSVAAVGPAKVRAYYSQYNSAVDVAGPGGDLRARSRDGVLSTSGDDSGGSIAKTYRYLQGTSMAAPHVAGVVALMKSVYPAFTPAQFDLLLQQGKITEDLGQSGRDDLYGYGLIDARRAVAEARQLAGTPVGNSPAVPVASPESLEIRATQGAAELTLANAGGGSFSVTSVSPDQAWVSVQTLSANSRYRLSVDRSALPSGIYTVIVRVQTTAGSLNVPLRVEVDAGRPSANIGTLYVLAIDAATLESVGQADVRSVNGTYTYELSDLPAGEYLIGAGSDLDNDGFVCDPGEACGAYPSLDGYAKITITGGDAIRPVDFLAGFIPVISANALGEDGSAALRTTPGFRRLE